MNKFVIHSKNQVPVFEVWYFTGAADGIVLKICRNNVDV
jgi:hypothetical protein